MTTVLTLGRTNGAYQGEGCDTQRSVETLVLAASQTLSSGRIIGRVGAEAATYTVAAAVAKAGNAGNGTAVLTGTGVGHGITVGTYKARAISALIWEFIYPDGAISQAEINDGVAYVDRLKFKIDHGATPFAAGDEFSWDVTAVPAANAGQVKAWDPDATDGSEVAYGVSYAAVSTGVGETTEIVAHVRECRVWGKYLDYGDATADQIAAANAALEQKGLIVA